MLADRLERHEALLTAGTFEAAETVRAQIDRVEATQREHAQKQE